MGFSLDAFGGLWGALGPLLRVFWRVLGIFFPSGGRLGGDVAYDVIFGVVSESFGEGFSLIFNLKMGSS